MDPVFLQLISGCSQAHKIQSNAREEKNKRVQVLEASRGIKIIGKAVALVT